MDLRDRGKIIGVVTLLALEASHEFVRMSGCGRYGWKNNLKIELRRFFPLSGPFCLVVRRADLKFGIHAITVKQPWTYVTGGRLSEL